MKPKSFLIDIGYHMFDTSLGKQCGLMRKSIDFLQLDIPGTRNLIDQGNKHRGTQIFSLVKLGNWTNRC